MDTDKNITLIQGALVKQLDVLRPRPRVMVEESPLCEGNIHAYVVSRYFSGMQRHERFNFVWRRLTEALPWEVVQHVTRLHVWTDREFKRWLAATDGTEAPEAEPEVTAAAAL